LAKYLEHEDQTGFHSEVVAAMGTVFPDQQNLEKAQSLLAQDKLEEAEQLTLELISSQPGHGLFHATLADIRFRQGRLKEAIASYKTAIETHPSHRNYFFLGHSYSLSGDHRTAVRYFTQAYELAPRQVEVLAELCRTYGQIEQLELANRYGKELLALDPHAPDGLIVSVIHAMRTGDRDKATRFYREFLIYGKDHPDYEVVKQAFKQLIQ